MKQKSPHSKLAALICFAVTLSSTLGVARGAAAFSAIVECLPEAPTICVGEEGITTPSPAIDADNKPVMMGGYTWDYTFVEGLAEGTDDMDAIQAATTGLTVNVAMDTNATTCSITVGDNGNSTVCNSCSPVGCPESTDAFSKFIAYDCTNLENGASSLDKCVSINDPFLYPFELPPAEELPTPPPSKSVAPPPVGSGGRAPEDLALDYCQNSIASVPQHSTGCGGDVPNGYMSIVCEGCLCSRDERRWDCFFGADSNLAVNDEDVTESVGTSTSVSVFIAAIAAVAVAAFL